MKFIVFLNLILSINVYSLRQIAFTKPTRINKSKSYIIDIDGTICDTVNSDYLSSQPKKDIIEKFNKLYDDGYEVHYWTARGAISKKNWDYWTKRQLEGWGVKYTSINMDKPHYDYWIDDKSINVKDI